jgi:hypothetical protein
VKGHCSTKPASRWALLAGLALLAACSAMQSRKQQRLAAYDAFSPAEKRLVDQGKIEPGMDTNAVYIAWGPPSAVVHTPGSPPQTVWIYFGSRPVLAPNWSCLPTNRGYWTLEYTPTHYSAAYTKAEVVFQNGRMTASKRFGVPAS